MVYKYDLHVHTSAASKCGKSTPEEQVRFYKELGFTGIFITDHFYRGNTCVDKDLPWKKWVKGYCEAYKRAKAEGKKAGLQVFFGWETTYGGEDFLIYGLDEKWLLAHPEIASVDQAEQYRLVHESGGFLVQAHPFRERHYMSEIKLHPYHVDAMEVCNACNNYHEDLLAYDYAKAHGIPMTAGSDLHKAGKTKSHCIFGIRTKKKLRKASELKDFILSGAYELNVPDGWLFGLRNTNPFFTVREFDGENVPKILDSEFYPGMPAAEDPTIGHKKPEPEKKTEEVKA